MSEQVREIVFDTETTGMDPFEGDRIIEIGCVEVINQVPTGRTYHQYINPEREIPADATAVHGITDEMVKDKPVFAEIFTEFLEFVGQGTLVAHNASFDMKFINYELKTVGHPSVDKRQVIDSLAIARKKFPGSPASLDALCRRFGIDLSGREFHGALLDAQLLAEVYLELNGGRQHGLSLKEDEDKKNEASNSALLRPKKTTREPRHFKPSEEELAAHAELLEQITDPLWKDIKAS